MKRTLTLSLILVMALAATSSPAYAKTSDDIELCKSALVNQGYYAADEDRVKFVGTRGTTQVRTLRLKLKDRSAEQSFNVSCKLRLNEIIDLTIARR